MRGARRKQEFRSVREVSKVEVRRWLQLLEQRRTHVEQSSGELVNGGADRFIEITSRRVGMSCKIYEMQ